MPLTEWKYYLTGEFLAYCKSDLFEFSPVVFFDFQEELGAPYKVEAVIILETLLDDLHLGQMFCIGLGSIDQPFRLYIGRLWQFRYEGSTSETISAYNYEKPQHVYRIWIYHSLATLGNDIRFHIWEMQTKTQIINEILTLHNIQTISLLQDDPIVYETNTQYKESSLNYILRLMQEKGIFGYFQMDQCICEDLANPLDYHFEMPVYMLCDNILNAQEVLLDFQGVYFEDVLFEQIINFQLERYTLPSALRVYAYDQINPSAPIIADANNISWQYTTSEDTFEPILRDELEAKQHVEQIRAIDNTKMLKFKACTTSYKANVGRKIIVTGSSNIQINGEYFIEKSHQTLNKNQNGWEYLNNIEGVACSPNYMPEITKNKPIVHGNQLAIVVGSPVGQNINVDEKGRVRVKFVWADDLNNSLDFIQVSNPSAWAKVMQWGASGDFWGNVSFPRVGQEVVVGFLNGDPDLPIIIGSVHNDIQRFPYPLPENSPSLVMRTKSIDDNPAVQDSNGPLDVRFNEFSMHDNHLMEQVYLRAQNEFKYDILGPVNGLILGEVIRYMRGDAWISTFCNRYEFFGFGGIWPGEMPIPVGVLAMGFSEIDLTKSIDLCSLERGYKMTYIKDGGFSAVLDAGDIVFKSKTGTIFLQSLVMSIITDATYNALISGLYSIETMAGFVHNAVGGYSLSVEGEAVTNVVGDYSVSVEGECSMTTVGNMNITSDALQISSLGDLSLTSVGELSITAASINISAANIDINTGAIEIVSGSVFTITAGADVTITASIISLFGI